MKKIAILFMLLLPMAFTSCSAGDRIVTMGTYQQDSPQKTPISWIVLKEENDSALLLSLHLLAARPWDESGEHLTWDASSIRRWLNHDFLRTAFSQAEIDAIMPTVLDNSDQHGYGTPAGPSTTDRVFLLSVNEFDSLVCNTGYATATPTPVAIAEGAYVNDHGQSAWWLRSPGATVDSPSYLSSAGELGTRAHKATERVIGIRPAIWVKRSK